MNLMGFMPCFSCILLFLTYSRLFWIEKEIRVIAGSNKRSLLMIFLKNNKIILLIQDIYYSLIITKFTVEKGLKNKNT